MARRTSKTTGPRPSISRPVRSLRITAPTAPARTSSSDPTTSGPVPETSGDKPVTEDDVNHLSIASLTLDTPLIPLTRKKRRVPATPLPFLSLPSELRIKIYAYFYFDEEDVDTLATPDPNNVIDLDPGNYKRFHRKLGLLRVCKQVHAEACFLFYSTRTFRIFPTYPGRHFKTKKPLLARMKPHQRQTITSLELRLGPGWGAPPRGWVVNPALGLQDCVDVEILKVYVECDPSDSTFNGFRRSDGFYEDFCMDLLSDILDGLPSVQIVEFDARRHVKKSGKMMKGLIDAATEAERLIEWGPRRGWTDDDEDDSYVIGPGQFPQQVPISGSETGPHDIMAVA
ncbi:hypothetical protein AK830_g10626 [Neonectria ditissima]|uniref:F-box domain-containing protein n=1 Tax=Neonectria ditissima TaxID=78410 RepID=A0A0P7AT44_9HYPO|nr:hypothetical protein AK830_g10626 [Neonectria ditissima]